MSADRSAGHVLRVPENDLHKAWKRLEGRPALLTGMDGMHYSVVYAGMHSPHSGPDFRGAILERQDGVRLYGDVEIHFDEREFFEHRHQLDSKYNGVVAHLFVQPGSRHAITSSGINPVRIVLSGESEAQHTVPGTPLRAAPPEADKLMTLGNERFAAKAGGFKLEIKRSGADQALYSGIAECLGYSNNRSAFLCLSQRLNWNTVSAIVRSGEDPLPTLIWAAGLGARPHRTNLRLPATPKPVWSSRYGRPANRPEHRIRGLAGLIKKFSDKGGPVDYGVAALGASTYKRLNSLFVAEGDGRALIGSGRAAEIVVNALLPAMYALGELRDDAALMRRAYELYSNHPALPENCVTREIRRLAGDLDLNAVTKANEQQGLHRWYREAVAPKLVERQLQLV